MKNAPFRHRAEYALYLGFKGLVRVLPHAGAATFGMALGSLAHRLLAERRRVARNNLALALPEVSDTERCRIVRGGFQHLGQAACETISSLRFSTQEYCRRVTLEGWEHLQQADSLGRGVLLMAAHLGWWEIGAWSIGLYRGPMHAVVRPLDNPYVNRELVFLRTRFGNELIPKRGAARGMMKVLRGGGRACILIDQRVGSQEGIQVPFFGRPARTSPLLARLSRRSGAPVVPFFGLSEHRGRYRVVFRPPIHPDLSGGSGDQAVQSLTRTYLEVVEREIRKRPELWLWMHDRWKPE